MASLRKAINAKCRDCRYDPEAVGTWLQQVMNCPDSDCPLHSVRPQREPRKQMPLKSQKAGKSPDEWG